MSTDNKNMTAFPKVTPDGDKLQNGLTKREYFAATAPNEIPNWFVHTNTERPKEPAPLKDGDPFKKEVEDWHRDPCYDLPEELQWYQKKWDEYFIELSKWEKENDTQRYFQWRWYYADQMLSEL